MNLLITGGFGFIGSNFISFLIRNYREIHIVNLDKITYAANPNNLHLVNDNPNYLFIHGDICDRKLVESIFNDYHINGVIHFAAESHVDNSIENPDIFIKTNVVGTYTLLDVARKHWMVGPNTYKKDFIGSRFHHISTDEVFGTLGTEGFFTEESPYSPNSPYSASKASSDMLVRSYFHTYGMDVVTTNCSNNFGPNQHEEKLIPTIIRRALALESIPVYGDGRNIRDWLFVEDHCHAIYKVFSESKAGETYLIGGNNERTNIDVVHLICGMLDEIIPIKNGSSYKDLIVFVNDRPGHDYRYAINDKKFRKTFKEPLKSDFKANLLKTIKYYLKVYN